MAQMAQMQYWQQCLEYYHMTNGAGGAGAYAGAPDAARGGQAAMETSTATTAVGRCRLNKVDP
jgi:hypothetical protein